MQTREILSGSRLVRRVSSKPGKSDTQPNMRRRVVVRKWVGIINLARYIQEQGKFVIVKRVSIQYLNLSGLRNISYRINDQRSDGKQEVMTDLNTISLWGGAAHLTHTKGKHLGNNHTDE